MKALMLVLVLGLLLCFFGDQASADSSLQELGKETYLSYGCAICHGRNGEGDGINAKNFDPEPTNFHDPKDYRQGRDKSSIQRSIRDGIKEPTSIMPSFEHLSKEELKALAAYIISLQKKIE